ncbi:MAG: efflux transporter periplasmic adaptor subunit, partial [Acidobacteriia bacterium]|nr:efflux transporter periplasmic adaptor subunit [Terriglobia bacterium]
MERKKIRRRVFWLIAAIAIVAAIVFALIPSSLLVEAGRVSAGSLQVTLDQEGETRARDRFVISAPVSGHLLRI